MKSVNKSSNISKKSVSWDLQIEMNSQMQKLCDLEDFEIFMEALERDNFSTIYLAREKRIKRMVALKVFSKEAIVQRDEGLESQLNNEIIIRSNLKHPNILPLFGYFYDNKRVYMFQEYAARSELYTEMKEVGFFSNEQAATYIHQLADALNFCHSKKVMHNDLNLQNLLLYKDGRLKIADFGWSAPSTLISTGRVRSVRGTLDYMSPETLVEGRPRDEKADLWSVGVLAYELLSGKTPFHAKSEELMCKKIANADYKCPVGMNAAAVDLVARLLCKNPNERLSLQGVMTHPWVKSHAILSFF